MSLDYRAISKKRIEIEAHQLRERILGGTLYGEAINRDDVDALIVAAYYMGRYDGMPHWKPISLSPKDGELTTEEK